MERKKIAVVQGHPDAQARHFGHALAAAYANAASTAGHEVRSVEVAKESFELLRSKDDWESDSPGALRAAQATIAWADHIVILYPLWLGTMPALLKGFLEQVMRPGFAMDMLPGGRWQKRLKGKSARIVITMGMPALVYRWYFGAHSLKSLERNILAFVGIGPVRATLIGMVEQSDARRRRWLQKIAELGRRAG